MSDKKEEKKEEKKVCDGCDKEEESLMEHDGKYYCKRCHDEVTSLEEDKADPSVEELIKPKKNNVGLVIFTSLLLIALVVSISTGGFREMPGATNSTVQSDVIAKADSAQVADNAIAQIKSMIPQDVKVELIEITEVDGSYRLDMNIDGKLFKSYTNLQGTLLFPEGVVLVGETECIDQCGNGVCQEGAPASVCLENAETCPEDCRQIILNESVIGGNESENI